MKVLPESGLERSWMATAGKDVQKLLALKHARPRKANIQHPKENGAPSRSLSPGWKKRKATTTTVRQPGPRQKISFTACQLLERPFTPLIGKSRKLDKVHYCLHHLAAWQLPLPNGQLIAEFEGLGKVISYVNASILSQDLSEK